ncbi:MAG: hypothetical protein CMD83_04630 [Gammaproteobacteria bacterium]|nr:hypothetical protein [Gammaproteobacteria bacterium]
MVFALCLSSPAAAEGITPGVSDGDVNLYDELMSTGEQTRSARITEGVIHSIDLAKRKGVIGCYTYYFGPPDLSIPTQMKLYGTRYGSIELLEPGMKVKVTYGDTGRIRIVLQVEQLSPDAETTDY